MKKFFALMFCVLLGSAFMVAGCAPKKASEQESAPQMEEPAAPAEGYDSMEAEQPAEPAEGSENTEEEPAAE